MMKLPFTKGVGQKLLDEITIMQNNLEEKYPEINGPSNKLKVIIKDVEANISFLKIV